MVMPALNRAWANVAMTPGVSIPWSVGLRVPVINGLPMQMGALTEGETPLRFAAGFSHWVVVLGVGSELVGVEVGGSEPQRDTFTSGDAPAGTEQNVFGCGA